MRTLPSDEEVVKAVESVMRLHKEVHSQKLLHSLVLKELRGENQYCSVSEDRVKKLASRAGAKIFVEKRRAGRETKRCYVCEGKLELVEGSGMRCLNCGFRIERKHAPSRYVFYRK